MRPFTSLLPVVLSVAVAVLPAEAQRRPRFGGTLRIELRERPASADAPSPWFPSVFETLVRLDSSGRPEPSLAVSWSHDPQSKRWLFTPRGGVKFHDGSPWKPEPASLAFPDNLPIDELLIDLAQPRNAVAVKPAEGPPLGTGPFRISAWEPGVRLALTANPQHWEGRPFLDAVEIAFNRSRRDQAQSFELGRADIVEAPLAEARRLRGPLLALSPPALLLALVASRPVNGLSEAIDRSSIHSVLLQKQGEIAGAILPQFLSGVSFLFPSARDMTAARTASAGAMPIDFYFDRDDPLLRSIGERIALNAGEAGFTLRPSTSTSANLRLGLLRISAASPRVALNDVAQALGLALPPAFDHYASERALLDSRRIVPLFHLPAAYRLSGRVRGWNSAEPWPLAGVWLDETGARP